MLKKIIAISLICVFLLALLSGCKDKDDPQSVWPTYENLDKRLVIASSSDYEDCQRHNLSEYEFYAPDSIIVIRDSAVVGEYAKGDAVYEKLLQLHTQSLQDTIQAAKDRYEEHGIPYPPATMGIVGSPVNTEDGLVQALMGGMYLVYTYTEKTYAPVYFEIKEPSDNAQFMCVQPALEGESRGPFAFQISQELWDYLGTFKK